DSSARVYRDPVNLAARELDLAGVQAGADFEPEAAHGIADPAGAAHGGARPVKSGQESVARRVDFPAAGAVEFLADDRVMARKELGPGGISALRGLTRRGEG